jgi:hypothetical protein
MDSTTITSSSFTLTGPSGAVAATVAYDSTSNKATLTPSAALAANTTYTAKLDTTVAASDGTPLPAPYTWSFTTAVCPCRLFSATSAPLNQDLSVQDGRNGSGPWSLELGVKVQVDQPMALTAIRYYREPGETGLHTGKIWSAAGTLIGQVDFATENGTGWESQALPTPLTLQPNTTYIISVNQNVFYGSTPGGLQTQIFGGPLSSVADGQNGVYGSAAGTFPNQSFGSSNYFVDADVMPIGATPPLSVIGASPKGGATGVSAGTTVTATFSRAMNASTITSSNFTLTPSGGAPLAAAVTY